MTNLTGVRAFIFDMDGTVLDTEKYYLACWPKALAHFGYEVSREDILTLRSLGRPFAPERLKEITGDPGCDYWAVRDYRRGLVEECIEKNGISLKPGALELFAELKKRGISRAIATATDEERTARFLEKCGLAGAFDKIICASMVERGKPAPDIYELAVRELGLTPEECVAVEDAPNGIKSAYSAGLKVIMVPDASEPDEELAKLLFARVDTLADICRLL
ncbi:MAG: HAD family phosphatase [Lachnospiraceae bacterium]|nr:HAD family phosphatase [Lachnospiraceae bacterium]